MTDRHAEKAREIANSVPEAPEGQDWAELRRDIAQALKEAERAGFERGVDKAAGIMRTWRMLEVGEMICALKEKP